MKTSDRLELLLNIVLPDSYKDFIDKLGYLSLSKIGIEVYGYRPDFDIDKIPCVIAATKLNKEGYNLKENEIVISHTGFEDHIVVLDAASDLIFETNIAGKRKVIAKSFSGWLANLITENDLASE